MRITAGMVARVRSLAEPRWSPDGKWLAYLESFDGRGDVILAPAAGGRPARLTAEPGSQPTASYGGGILGWLDPTTIMFVAPDGQLHALPIAGGPTRQLTRLDGRISAPVATPDGRLVACMVSSKTDQHIAIVDPSGREWPRRASRGGDFVFDPTWSPNGALAWHEWNAPNMSWDGGYIRLLPAAGAEPNVGAGLVPALLARGEGRGQSPPLQTVDGGDDVSVSQPRFSPDGRLLAYVGDRSGWWNLWLYDVASGQTRQLIEEEAEHGGPVWGPGGMRFSWSPDGRQIAFVRTGGGFSGIYVAEVATGASRPVGPQDGSVTALSWSPAGDRLAALWGSASRPTRLALLDPSTGELTDLAHGAPAGFEAAETPTPEAISWPTPDGAQAHGLFYRPPGAERPPLIVRVHGGPTGHAEAGFDARTSYWLDRGWAILQVNYRGSTGYGRAYHQALRDNWGVHDVSDTVSGARHLAERGLADRGRMAVMGGSAGGYTVLLCLALHPDVFAAGVDLYGVADLFKLTEETHRFEAHYSDFLIGPLPAQYQRYVDRSPVHLADRIRSPLLVLQGDKDEVVPLNQSEAMVAALKRNDVDVELHVYEGEGHGWRKLSTVLDELDRIDTFLRRHVLHLASTP